MHVDGTHTIALLHGLHYLYFILVINEPIAKDGKMSCQEQ